MKKFIFFLAFVALIENLNATDTIIEDAEDNTTLGWTVSDDTPSGATISNVYDSERTSRVIELNGSGLENSYMLGAQGGWGNANAWNNTVDKKIKWSMKYSEKYIIYVSLQTANGHRLLSYTDSNSDDGISFGTIHHGLGQSSKNGTWQTFVRDLEADLVEFESNNTIISVNAFIISGSGRLDDIVLFHDFQPVPSFQSVGVGAVPATPLSAGTLFASPDGSGNDCTESLPCTFDVANKKLQSGSVLFLRGGTYRVNETHLTAIGIDMQSNASDSPYDKTPASGTEEAPIIIESYPGEIAIFDGGFDYLSANQKLANGDNIAKSGLFLKGDYYKIRNIKITRMGGNGLKIIGSHNIIEGVESSHNFINGIQINSFNEYKVADGNIVQYSLVHDNSDEKIAYSNRNATYKGGNQGDGINIVSANNTIVRYNIVYGNSDDGIDNFIDGNGTHISYNISYDNGRGNGDGNGIKFVGNYDYNNTDNKIIIDHNIAFENAKFGFNYNTKGNLIVKYNTAWKNKWDGFSLPLPNNKSKKIAIKNNISWGNISVVKGPLGEYRGYNIEPKARDIDVGVFDNSWQLENNNTSTSSKYSTDEIEAIEVEFESTDINSTNFLKPVNSKFDQFGVYATE